MLASQLFLGVLEFFSLVLANAVQPLNLIAALMWGGIPRIYGSRRRANLLGPQDLICLMVSEAETASNYPASVLRAKLKVVCG